jgi:hypothetical protein
VSLCLGGSPPNINSANTSQPKKKLKTAQKARVLGNFSVKSRSFCVVLRLFVALFEAGFSAKNFFTLPHPAYIAHFRQSGKLVAVIGLFFSKLFSEFG